MADDSKYLPPPGPPPNRRGDDEYAPPPGPPPSYGGQHISFAPASARPGLSSESYTPPPGPPPKRQYQHEEETYAPPQGPPPSKSSQASQDPPPYHDWTVIPDTSLLPPPPSISHSFSPTANAPAQDADAAAQWCAQYPLYGPRNLSPMEANILQNAHLMKPPIYAGILTPIKTSPGIWQARSRPYTNQRDTCLITALPLYAVNLHAPFRTETPKTIYFEVQILRIAPDAGLAIGFVAQPYPAWRLPGWQRGSLAVHGDDGRRYVNDDCGGKDFTSAFQPGQRVGLGMKFQVSRAPPGYGERNTPYGRPRIDVEIFFTRNGRREGGWNLYEEVDAQDDRGVEGLEGFHDLYGAVGMFGAVDFDVIFNSKDWLYHL